MSNEIERRPEQALVPFSGADLYRVSTNAAGFCENIVGRTAKNIQGRNFLPVEAWQAIAIAHGCFVSSGDVEETEKGFRAIGRICRADTGMVIACAEGFVGRDEPVWFGGEGKDKYGRPKTYPRRPEFAIRAMAQTRSMSRACRSAFAHVVVMINEKLGTKYETTPAEEMNPDEDVRDITQPPPSVMEPAQKIEVYMVHHKGEDFKSTDAIAFTQTYKDVIAMTTTRAERELLWKENIESIKRLRSNNRGALADEIVAAFTAADHPERTYTPRSSSA